MAGIERGANICATCSFSLFLSCKFEVVAGIFANHILFAVDRAVKFCIPQCRITRQFHGELVDWDIFTFGTDASNRIGGMLIEKFLM